MAVIVPYYDCTRQKKQRWIYLSIFIIFILLGSGWLAFMFTRTAQYSGKMRIIKSALVCPSDPYTHYTNSSNNYPVASYSDPSMQSFFMLAQFDFSQFLLNQSKLVGVQYTQFSINLTYNTNLGSEDIVSGIVYVTSAWMPEIVRYADLDYEFVLWFELQGGSSEIQLDLPIQLLDQIINQQLYLGFTILMPSNSESIVLQPLASYGTYILDGYDREKWVGSTSWIVFSIFASIGVIFLGQFILAQRTNRKCSREEVQFIANIDQPLPK